MPNSDAGARSRDVDLLIAMILAEMLDDGGNESPESSAPAAGERDPGHPVEE